MVEPRADQLSAASRLSEREREVLRLLVRGHDAKSIARALDLSIHAVNERLREARRKLGVSSSREAARILAAREGSGPNFLGDKEIGVGGGARADEGPFADARRSLPLLFMGAVMILILVSTIAVWTSGEGEDQPPHPAAAPRVVATSPATGSAIRPGPFVLSVTFDRPMRAGNYSFVQVSAETYPDCGGSRPTQSSDGRTFTLRCTARPGRRYEVWFNSPPYMNFRSVDGVPAQPHRLLFRTRGR